MSPDASPLSVSAVIAVRDGEELLADALASIAAQTQAVAEIVVVDGHSTDDTVAIARGAGARVVTQPGRGIADAYNCGVDASTSPLVAFLSHDDRWTPDKLEVQTAAFRADPDLLFSHAHFVYEVVPGFVVPAQMARHLDGPQPGPFMETLMARREVFDLVGRFDDAYSLANDVDWLARAKDAGAKGVMLPQTLLRKRLHGGNASLALETNNREMLAVLRRSVQRKRGGVRDAEV